jgi:hypothetical protein
MIRARETAHFCEKKNACEKKCYYQQSVLKLMNDGKRKRKERRRRRRKCKKKGRRESMASYRQMQLDKNKQVHHRE